MNVSKQMVNKPSLKIEVRSKGKPISGLALEKSTFWDLMRNGPWVTRAHKVQGICCRDQTGKPIKGANFGSKT